MPTYTYHCPVCQIIVIHSQSIFDDSVPQCDNCQVELVKNISAPALSFKGGGWAHKEN